MRATVSRSQIRSETWSEPARDSSRSRVAIAFFPSRAEARQAIHHLGDSGFPIEHVAIVADGMQVPEPISGRAHTGWIAFQGASEGGMVGLFLSTAIGLVNVAQPLTAMPYMTILGTLGGAVVGLVLRLLGQTFSGDKRDIPTTSARPTRYLVMVDSHLSREASRLLEGPY